jgi:maltose alpha-D-glucosyltransferase/alpha-amylase
VIQTHESSGDPLWYKDAVIYELHVKSFYDSNDDGIGDFPGLIQKLDYVHELGVTAIWLLPFYPSPLRDDGYDIADYFNINPDYGTLADFKKFLREAHKRDIRVITELVINHTSDQHQWFQRSRRAKPASVWRDFYVWSDTSDRYDEARIIFTDFESSNWSWDPEAEAYYWHRFYSHQPDLNFDNPHVRSEILRVLDFWFKLGVDGMRLDAVPYLIERDGTNCKNLTETHEILKQLRAHVDEKFEDRMLLAEANQWPEDASAYFGEGDECHMAFHFPIMPRLFMGLRMEDRFPLMDMLEQSLDIPETCQWAMFLRNHDELTLEMVTDQERDYMYKAYAQDPRARINVGIRRRLAPLLENNRRRIELLNSLLMSLPGTPVLYYGDEIGMGDNYFLGDRDGVRTPMQWSPDRNAGFSKVNPHRLFLPVIIDSEYHYATVNVENQSRNMSSLYWFMRRLLGIRKLSQAFGRGRLEFLSSDNTKVLSFLRIYEDDTILVLANLSRYCQSVHVQIPDYAGYTVVELFSDNEFPPIGETSYAVTMAPHSFFWFALTPPSGPRAQDVEQSRSWSCPTTWNRLLGTRSENVILEALRRYLPQTRWFGGKGQKIRKLRIADHLTVPVPDQPQVYLLRVEVTYAHAPREDYLLPLGFATGETQTALITEAPEGVIGYIQTRDEDGMLYDAVHLEDFRALLLDMIARQQSRKCGKGRLTARRGRQFTCALAGQAPPSSSRVLKAEQSNTSAIYGETFFLKLYRRIEEASNPDVVLTRCLTENTEFHHLPAYAGCLDWQNKNAPDATLGLLLQFVPNETDAWSYTVDTLRQSFSWALTLKNKPEILPDMPRSSLQVDLEAIPEVVRDFIGPIYLDMIRLLGQRTAQLHHALATLEHGAEVKPEPFSLLYQKSLYQAIRGSVLKTFSALERRLPDLPDDLAPALRDILEMRKTLLTRLRRITERRMETLKIRTHGDYHLGQVLFTGKDFFIIDFEGEPARPMSERHLKQSALRDIAGMMRSFHYAAHSAVALEQGSHESEEHLLRHWADLWYFYVSGTFLNAYIEAAGTHCFIPPNKKDLTVLLETFILEKSVYELNYELNNRPDWLAIPLRGLDYSIKGRF